MYALVLLMEHSRGVGTQQLGTAFIQSNYTKSYLPNMQHWLTLKALNIALHKLKACLTLWNNQIH